LWHLLKRPGNSLAGELCEMEEIKSMEVGADVLAAAAIDAKYEGYLAKQARQVEGFRNLEKIKLPGDLDYGVISHLRIEAKEKLSKYRPDSLGQAGRIGGITPADITVIQVYLKKRFGGLV
jgi:tRNA uridine 5-carboxymethylaminomethyl modification enzyme